VQKTCSRAFTARYRVDIVWAICSFGACKKGDRLLDLRKVYPSVDAGTEGAFIEDADDRQRIGIDKPLLRSLSQATAMIASGCASFTIRRAMVPPVATKSLKPWSSDIFIRSLISHFPHRLQLDILWVILTSQSLIWRQWGSRSSKVPTRYFPDLTSLLLISMMQIWSLSFYF